MIKQLFRYSLVIITMVSVFSCLRESEPLPVIYSMEEGEEFPGGHQSSYDQSENAFGQPMPGLTGIDANYFFTGNSLFNQNWVAAPASTTARDGLGPNFNSKSCSGCHFKDGRGEPPSYYDQTSSGFLLRLSIPGTSLHGGPVPEPNYGLQLNDQAILGVQREGQVNVTYTEITGTFPDGEVYSLRKPIYSFNEFNYGDLDQAVTTSPRVAPHMIGLGLLEAIKSSDILSKVDESDGDANGISGRANYVYNFETEQNEIGRFGWKANQPTVRHQVASAFAGDLGVTSSIFPEENCTSPQFDCQNAANGGSPELDDENLHKVVIYSANLAVPVRPDANDQGVLKGKQLFNEIGCADCHTPSYITGSHLDFPNLSNEKIWPYTDLLLHDMGDELADGRSDYLATGNEWKTPPLWGIRLFSVVNGHSFYMHDGRARGLQEAILWHGGEGESSKNMFMNLTKEERNFVLLFLGSL